MSALSTDHWECLSWIKVTRNISQPNEPKQSLLLYCNRHCFLSILFAEFCKSTILDKQVVWNVLGWLRTMWVIIYQIRTQVNKFEQVSSVGHKMSVAGGSSSEQVWTGLQCWPPDVSSRGSVLGLMSMGDSEVQSIIGNGHLGTHLLWTDRHLWKHYLPPTSLTGSNKIESWFKSI